MTAHLISDAIMLAPMLSRLNLAGWSHQELYKDTAQHVDNAVVSLCAYGTCSVTPFRASSAISSSL